ncbi:hypothetical protein BS17DRAFT_775905 [Gyrodon lividus]|nr:hypothetical protein BS17DRAFT_775905 [Gyrodon lividus]
MLPTSPAFEALVNRDGKSGLTAAVERFERTYNHKSSTSSLGAVEEQPTREEDEIVLSHDQGLPLSAENSQPENELADAELRWPASDEEADEASLPLPIPEEIPNSDRPLLPYRSPVSGQTYQPFVSPSGRGQQFRYGSLDISLPVNGHSVGSSVNDSSDPRASQESRGSSQPFELQTQAPYFSQTMNWSQSQ